MKVNYSKRIKHYNTSRKPPRQIKLFTWILYVGSRIIMVFQPYKIEKINGVEIARLLKADVQNGVLRKINGAEKNGGSFFSAHMEIY